MWTIFALTLIVLVIYWFLVKPLKHWDVKKVPYVQPVPIFGNMWPVVCRKLSIAEVIQKLYQTFPDKCFFGIYQFTSRTLVIRNPNLIKEIMVKEFTSFPEHRPFISNDVDPLWNKNLLAMEAERWHEMRATLSPSFTSSKMKHMFALMNQCTKRFVEHYSKQGQTVTIEFKDAFGRFANDVIASTAFGIKCDSLEEPENEFYMMGRQLINFGGARGFIIMLNIFIPIINKLLRMHMISENVANFFRSIVKETIKLREEKNIIRPDMLHLLMEARKGQLQHENDISIPEAGFAAVEESDIGRNCKKRKLDLSVDDITAQALLFFFAGFDSVSTMMSYTAYELAINTEVQKKLQKEVDQVFDKCDNITYETLMGMKYLDQVISESLRKWPSFIATNRKCVRPFTLQSENTNETVFLEKGATIFIPIRAIHRDAKYYPHPDKFDPERFSDENKNKVVPYTYLPFGAGPRNCIGSRFALMEGKLIIAEMVSKFEFVPVQQTQIPIQLSRKNWTPVPDDGFWLGLKPRNV